MVQKQGTDATLWKLGDVNIRVLCDPRGGTTFKIGRIVTDRDGAGKGG